MLENLEAIEKMGETNIEATTKAIDAVSKTAKAIASEIAEYSKSSFESGFKAMQKLLDVKSLDKAIEVQCEYAESVFNDLAARASTVGQLYADLGTEVVKPFAASVAKTLVTT